jgi:ABC-type branched-subunit amino acid transport system substrate-binding protein
VEWVAARGHIPVLSLAASHPRAWQNTGWLFTVGVPFEPRVAPLARDFRARGFERGYLLYDPQQVMARDLAFALKGELGPVRELACSTASPDFRATVATLVREKADGVFFVAAPGSYLGEFAEELRAGGSRAALYSNVAGFDEGLHRAGGKALEGLRLSESFSPQADRPEVRDFVAGFRELFPETEPGRSAAQAYDAVRLVSQEPLDRQALCERLQRLGTELPAYPGVSGAVSTGQMPTAVRVYLMEVRSGREELLREDPER